MVTTKVGAIAKYEGDRKGTPLLYYESACQACSYIVGAGLAPALAPCLTWLAVIPLAVALAPCPILVV